MSINMVPQQTINYEVFFQGDRLMGTASVDLGDIEYLATEIKGAAIAGTIEMPTRGHLQAPEVTLHWRTLFENPIKLLRQNAHMLSLRGAQQGYDAATGELKIIPVRIDLRGHLKSANLGKLEPGENTETETTLVSDYIKITADGKVMWEFDLFNFVMRFEDGEDFLGDVREALGLS